MELSQPKPSAPPESHATAAGGIGRWADVAPAVALFAWIVLKQDMALHLLSLPSWPYRFIAITATLLLLFPWFCLAKSQPLRIAGLLLLNLVLTFVTYGDILYYRSAGDFVSLATMRFVWQLVSVGDAVLSLMRPTDLWMWIDLPIMATWAWWRLRRNRSAQLVSRIGPRRAMRIAAVGVALFAIIVKVDPFLGYQYFGHTVVTAHLGTGGYHMLDAVSYAGRMGARWGSSTDAVTEVKGWLEERGNSEPPPSSRFGVAKGKNVILLQVESLQAFTLGLRVNGHEVTPNLNRLMQRSIYFNDFYTQIGQGTTADADLLGNCSLYPTATGAAYYDHATNDYRCMPTVLREHGYSAAAMQAMRPDFWNLSAAYPHVGFQRFYSKNDFIPDQEIGLGLSDESFLRQSVQKLKNLQQPYYAFVVTLTSHVPFDFDNLPRTLDVGQLADTKVGHYLNAIHYTDGAIGKFVERLEAEGILDKSILAIYGDHAGVYRSSTGMSELLRIPPDDEIALTQVEKRVPFIIHLPGSGEGEVQTHAAGEVDIAPTLAGLLGVPTDTAYFMGRDLFRQPEGPVVFHSGALMTDQHHYWPTGDDPRYGTCFSRATGKRVPPEQCHSIAEEGARRLRLSRLIIERNLIPKLAQP